MEFPVSIPSEAEKANANLYTENMRKFMARQAGLKTAQLGFKPVCACVHMCVYVCAHVSVYDCACAYVYVF